MNRVSLRSWRVSLAGAAVLSALVVSAAVAGGGKAPKAVGWTHWRGPLQTGVSLEKNLPEKVDLQGGNLLWTMDVSGRGTPVIANGKIFILGYSGEGPELQETIIAADAETGKKLWEHRFNDFLSDVIYDRYAIGGPAVDPETGNVYVMTTAGIFSCYNEAGKLLWQHSMMENFGRLTFPNGRMGWPQIEDDLVIIRGITGNWGAQGAASDRLYAYDKKSGQLVWAGQPGVAPKDNCFSSPYIATVGGKRIGYTTVGDGSVAAFNARTGEALWRVPFSAGSGPNASVVLFKNTVIAIQDAENVDNSESGRMTAFKIDAPTKPAPVPSGGGAAGPPILTDGEAWRNPLSSFSSSPVLVGERLYQVDRTGVLHAVDANSGKILWRKKLAPDQLHASPVYGDGKLYIPVQEGKFHILKPTDTGAEETCVVQLEGNCLGAPAIYNGKIYVHTNKKLYCWGKKGKGVFNPAPAAEVRPRPGKPVAIQVIPAEVILHPGEKASLILRGIDENGFPTGNYDPAKAKIEKYIPPTAAVKAEMNATVSPQGEIVASNEQIPSAGAWKVTVDNLEGFTRGRVIPGLPLKEDFEKFQVTTPHMTEGVNFAYPPLPWIGARFRWEVRDLEGNKVLRKTLDNVFFQRAQTFIGGPAMKNYTVEADVMSDGNRRGMAMVGLINQRYLVMLQGNAQTLEISSNLERIHVTAPFAWQPKTWYHLKTRVDVAADGSGVVRAKAWKKGETEPSAWTLEAPHKTAHQNGSPGLYGFSPQSRFAVYIDNISVTPN
jgi:outer membrane protein assembly factor BamB